MVSLRRLIHLLLSLGDALRASSLRISGSKLTLAIQLNCRLPLTCTTQEARRVTQDAKRKQGGITPWSGSRVHVGAGIWYLTRCGFRSDSARVSWPSRNLRVSFVRRLASSRLLRSGPEGMSHSLSDVGGMGPALNRQVSIHLSKFFPIA